MSAKWAPDMKQYALVILGIVVLTLYVLNFSEGTFLHIDATQVVEILPQIKQEPTYSI